jgi:quinol monooxygenase YgiN
LSKNKARQSHLQALFNSTSGLYNILNQRSITFDLQQIIQMSIKNLIILTFHFMATANGLHAQSNAAQISSVSEKMLQATLFIKPERSEAFIKAAEVIIQKTMAEPGCVSYRLLQNPYEKQTFTFLEVYKDQNAIDEHFNTSYIKEFLETISTWQSKPMKIKIFDVSEAKK